MSDDPFTGKWRFCIESSRLPIPAPTAWIQQIKATADSISVTEEIVSAAGRSSTVSVRARFDGEYYPVTGSPLMDTIAYRRIDARNISGTGKRGESIALVETAAVSSDRNLLTLNFSLLFADGKSADAVAVFERAEDFSNAS